MAFLITIEAQLRPHSFKHRSPSSQCSSVDAKHSNCTSFSHRFFFVFVALYKFSKEIVFEMIYVRSPSVRFYFVTKGKNNRIMHRSMLAISLNSICICLSLSFSSSVSVQIHAINTFPLCQICAQKEID